MHLADSHRPTFTTPLSLGFIKQHPVVSYYALVFAISWGGYVMVVGPGGIPATTVQFQKLGPFVYLAAIAGPSVAGLMLTALLDGRAGLRELRARLLRWRVDVRWYAVAVLTAPLLTTAFLFGLSLLSPAFLPGIVTTDDKAFLLLFGLAAGLMFGIFEELGWSGFAIPRLRRRHSILATGLTMGLVWGAWHFPMFWESDTFSGALPLVVLLARLFSWLPAYRVLMVWVYDHTESLLLAVLMHASLVVTQLILLPPALAGGTLLVGVVVLSAAWWLVVAAVAVANRGHLTRSPLRRVDEPGLTGRRAA